MSNEMLVESKEPSTSPDASLAELGIPNPSALRKSVTKTTDSKGRVVLGGRFANRPVIVESLSDTEMIIKLARVIPESEAWLYDNAAALTAVRTGLAQARMGKVTEGPDVDADEIFAAELED